MIEPNASEGGQTSHPALLEEVRRGLSSDQKQLPPKFFYDERGSQLFEQITLLPEYYPTRTERALLERIAPRWAAELRPRSLVELGAGSASKTRLILNAMQAAGGATCYVPVDISADFLATTAAALAAEYPELETIPLVADISGALDLPVGLPGPVVFAFLGSTIGNFEPDAAVKLIGNVRRAMTPHDRFLLGVDLRKDPEVIEAAYNDAQGVTAQFNLNMLHVLNAETGADFDPQSFRHHAFYHREHHRIEMHLVSTRAQWVTVPGAGRWHFRQGESLRTEISCKYDPDTVRDMMSAAGMDLVAWETDEAGYYALALGSC